MNVQWGFSGHERLQRVLGSAIASGTLAQFLVFVGVPHAGTRDVVTSLARILLCADDTKRPCNACPSCRAELLSHPDFLEVTTESKDGSVSVDAVRALLKHAELHSMLGGWRIAVLHDAHLLTHSAANALLKVLEEPPEHFVCLVTATSARQLLATIRSRAQVFRLSPLAATTASRSPARPARNESEILTALEGAASAHECEELLVAWEEVLYRKLQSGISANTGSLWKRIERARAYARAHVNPKLVIQELLLPLEKNNA